METKETKFKKPSREWVKTAAIILLAVLLVLTFFSNTILNASLVEVSTAAVTEGTISAKVKGTGTVSSIGNTKVTSSTTTTINTVRAKEGAEVSAGDVLFIMGEAEELEEAQDELDAARYALMRANNSYPVDTSSAKVAALEQDLANARQTLSNCETSDEEAAKKLKAKVEEDQAYIKSNESKYNAALITKSTYESDVALLQEKAQWAYAEWQADKTSEKEVAYNTAKAKLESYISTYKSCENGYDAALITISDYEAYKTQLTSDQAAYEAYHNHTNAEYLAAYSKVQALEDELVSAKESQYSSAATNAQTAGSAYINALEQQNKIEKLEKKVAELAGGEDNAILAPVGGTVTSISVSPGDKVSKDTVLCIIENPDMGYEISFSVTNDQAKRIKVGDTATVSNYYWGSEIIATVSSIKVDSKNPQTNKLVTCTLDGDVTTGSKITVAVGEKSASYDIIVPNSAIRNDSNGYFVLMVDSSRSNALGNRYFAKRVDVEVLASDDNNTAVSGNLSNGDFVITVSSSPIKSGDQIRLADSSSSSTNTDE